jgi:hypothetical protein
MISQAEASYTPLSGTALWCVNCSMFTGPNKCSLVEGPINPCGYCKFWEDKLKNHSAATVVEKDEPGLSDVHIPAALSGDDRKKKPWRNFSAFVSDTAKKPSEPVDVAIPTQNTVNKVTGSQLSGTGVLQSVPDRKQDEKPKKPRKTFSDILDPVEKKSQPLVGLAATVNALHQATPFGPKPKKLRYGSKTY